ncbi:Ribosome maturation factor RimP [bacterium HR19]|nr:Ribosome maturation factor RimP [bacterium HR19]
MEDLSKILSLIHEKVVSSGFELYDIEIKDAGSRLIIRVFIDKKFGFISIRDCVYVSRILEPFLESMIDRSFTLEVSSPGADRELKKDDDFERFKGMNVEILKKNGQRFVGKLMGKVGDEVFIMIDDKGKKGRVFSFKLAEINKVKLYPKI